MDADPSAPKKRAPRKLPPNWRLARTPPPPPIESTTPLKRKAVDTAEEEDEEDEPQASSSPGFLPFERRRSVAHNHPHPSWRSNPAERNRRIEAEASKRANAAFRIGKPKMGPVPPSSSSSPSPASGASAMGQSARIAKKLWDDAPLGNKASQAAPAITAGHGVASTGSGEVRAGTASSHRTGESGNALTPVDALRYGTDESAAVQVGSSFANVTSTAEGAGTGREPLGTGSGDLLVNKSACDGASAGKTRAAANANASQEAPPPAQKNTIATGSSGASTTTNSPMNSITTGPTGTSTVTTSPTNTCVPGNAGAGAAGAASCTSSGLSFALIDGAPGSASAFSAFGSIISQGLGIFVDVAQVRKREAKVYERLQEELEKLREAHMVCQGLEQELERMVRGLLKAHAHEVEVFKKGQQELEELRGAEAADGMAFKKVNEELKEARAKLAQLRQALLGVSEMAA